MMSCVCDFVSTMKGRQLAINTLGLSYSYVLFAAEITSLEASRDKLSRDFFPGYL